MSGGAGVVIVGAGQAGIETASALRNGGFAGPITLIGAEPYAPYQRPPLSKTFLSGTVAEDVLFMQEPSFFVAHDIRFRAGERVVLIDRRNRNLALASGDLVPYDHLVLATGARNRRLPCMDVDIDTVLSIRTLDESKRLKQALAGAQRVAIVGAGFLGLEAATVAIAARCEVEVIEAGPTALGRVVSPPMSAAFRRVHAAAGVRFHFDESVVAIHGADDGPPRLELRDAREIAADLVLVAIGVVPNAELAAAAGLAVHNGIVVDAAMSTEDPAISAIGDCAAFPFAAAAGRLVRLESVQNAVDQAHCLVARLLGQPAPYDQVPLFWSDQAGLRLQIAGIANPEDTAISRGNPDGVSFSVFRYCGDRLVGVESVNRPADHMHARKLLKHGISPAPAQAADIAFALKSLLTQPLAAL